MKKVKISEQTSLVKDIQTGAIINNDDDAYHHALIRKKKNKEFIQLQKDVAYLKEKLEAIESLLILNK